tara:strand:- start:10559 stop:12493 length:1935 start_codon:yes stop_codon:yes gene_type:complete
MAINLTDIVTVMKNKWTYGDKFFGYKEEFNDNHDTLYPSLLITPPSSVFPQVGKDSGWENYTFEVYFSDLYGRTAQQTVSLDQAWVSLQGFATEWLNNFLKNYQDNAPILAFLEDESVSMERYKEVANDQLIQIKMTFTWRVLSYCFRPVSSTLPNEINNLALWLRADSSTVFNPATARISNWNDYSGNGNNTSQSNKILQPIRQIFGGANNQIRTQFNGTSELLTSDSNSPISNSEFTIFTVAQANKATPAFANTYSTRFEGSTDAVDCGNPASGNINRPQQFSFTDGAGTDKPFTFSVWALIDPAATPPAAQPWRGIMAKSDYGANKEWSLEVQYPTGYTFLILTDNVTGGTISVRITESLPKGEWMHVVATYDGTAIKEGLELYLNGQLQTVDRFLSGTYNSMDLTTADLKIGVAPNSMYGEIDEVALFTKQFSAAEVLEIYNSGNPTDLSTITFANLIGWWRMGDGGATYPTIPDDSPNNNAATMSGTMSQANFVEFTPTSQKGDYFSYASGNVMISLGSASSRPYFRLTDTSAPPYAGEWNVRLNREVVNDTNNYHIITAFLDATNMSLQTNDNASQDEILDTGWGSPTFNANSFNLGYGANLGYLDGNLQEIIVFNRALSLTEKTQMKDYLNNKYKIY